MSARSAAASESVIEQGSPGNADELRSDPLPDHAAHGVNHDPVRPTVPRTPHQRSERASEAQRAVLARIHRAIDGVEHVERVVAAANQLDQVRTGRRRESSRAGDGRDSIVRLLDRLQRVDIESVGACVGEDRDHGSDQGRVARGGGDRQGLLRLRGTERGEPAQDRRHALVVAAMRSIARHRECPSRERLIEMGRHRRACFGGALGAGMRDGIEHAHPAPISDQGGQRRVAVAAAELDHRRKLCVHPGKQPLTRFGAGAAGQYDAHDGAEHRVALEPGFDRPFRARQQVRRDQWGQVGDRVCEIEMSRRREPVESGRQPPLQLSWGEPAPDHRECVPLVHRVQLVVVVPRGPPADVTPQERREPLLGRGVERARREVAIGGGRHQLQRLVPPVVDIRQHGQQEAGCSSSGTMCRSASAAHAWPNPGGRRSTSARAVSSPPTSASR